MPAPVCGQSSPSNYVAVVPDFSFNDIPPVQVERPITIQPLPPIEPSANESSAVKTSPAAPTLALRRLPTSRVAAVPGKSSSVDLPAEEPPSREAFPAPPIDYSPAIGSTYVPTNIDGGIVVDAGRDEDQATNPERGERGGPPQLSAWWQDQVQRSWSSRQGPQPITVNGLVGLALAHSAQVHVLRDEPEIRETAIIEAMAEFDWVGFLETKWKQLSEPVGSQLTTGGALGPSRFRDKRYDFSAGARRRTMSGGTLEASQQYGYERSNSIFFVPNDQGTARLTLSYTQPLLRGAGKVYNGSLILLAQIDSDVSRDELSRELQKHLLDVVTAYWDLYRERSVLLQRRRLYERGQAILEDLEHRSEIDVLTNQIIRARAAVASRHSDLYRAETRVRNVQSRVVALVNAPDLGSGETLELIPQEIPSTNPTPVDLQAAMETALRCRPEMSESLRRIKSSSVRLDMANNEMLPILDVVLETYVSGLRGSSNIGGAFVDQFGVGEPSYTAGLQMEVPLGNRAAKARQRRRCLELRQLQSQFRGTMETLKFEVSVAVREVETAYLEMLARHRAMKAADSEVEYIQRRWRLMPGEDRSAALILEDLLAAQERLAAEEAAFLEAQVNYSLAQSELKRATGTLLQLDMCDTSTLEGGVTPPLSVGEDQQVVVDGSPISHVGPNNGGGPWESIPREN
ncbi:MAG: TolC family protein [Pirellulaceae bacterium]